MIVNASGRDTDPRLTEKGAAYEMRRNFAPSFLFKKILHTHSMQDMVK